MCKLILDPAPEKKFFSFCYKGHYWDNWQNLNKVCRFDMNLVLILISWMSLFLENTHLSIYGYHLSIRGTMSATDFQMAEKKIT